MKKLLSNNKGFSLIELIIVIAIIAILAGIIISSFASTRAHSRDSSAISRMNQIRPGTEFDYNLNNSFYGMCPSSSQGDGRYDTAGSGDNSANNPVLNNIKEAQAALRGTTGEIRSGEAGDVICSSDNTTYGVSIQLNTDYYCVDSTGFANTRVTAGLSNGICPTS